MSNSAQIILDWLNKDLSFIPKVTDIKKSFYNGYLFGKIFKKSRFISDEEFSKFKDSEKEEDINLNFILIEKYCKKLFNLILMDNEINNIKKKNNSAAGVLLYKIRNGIYKLKINFNNIETFGNNFSNDEIAEQINNIIKNQFGNDIEENDKNGLNKSLFGKIKDISNNNIKESFIKYNENDNNSKTFIRKIDINMNKKGIQINKILPSIKTMKSINKFEYKKTNYEKLYSNNADDKIKISYKKILAPLKYRSNSTENIFTNNKTNNLFNPNINDKPLIDVSINDIPTSYKLNFNTGKNFDSKTIDVKYFNKKLDEIGITEMDYKLNENIINNYKNKFNEKLLKKTNEKINKNETIINQGLNINSLINMKSVEEISKELKNKISKNIEFRNKLRDNNNINFMKIDKNYFKMNSTMKSYTKNYPSKCSLRKNNYSQELLKRNQQKIHENNMKDNKFLLYRNIFPQLSSTRNIINNNITSYNSMTFQTFKNKQEKEFNSETFFQNLNYETISSFKSQCIKRYEKKRKISNRIKEIILYIIDMTMEVYIYQLKHKCEIMDLETFIKFNLYFIKNKNLRKKYIPEEESVYKRSGKIDQTKEIETINKNALTIEDKNSIEDYIYYIGEWDDKKIFNNKLRGIRFDYKYITNNINNEEKIINKSNNNSYFGIIEYEPTALESEDLTIPNSVPDNYNLGNLMYEILSNHFNINEINLNNNNEENNNLVQLNGKWDYIPYKISLIGYPLSGRKTIAKKIVEIYPNLKIYSMNKIISHYFNLYLQLADPIEKPERKPNKKHTKRGLKSKEKEKEKEEKNKIVDKDKESIFEKAERKKKFNEMKPIFDSMKSYIDYKINNELYPSNEDTNNNKNDFCVLPDESLCLLLIKKIEEDFPLLSENKTKKIMMEKQKNIKDMEKQIELIKKRKLEAKKPNPKDDLQIEKLEKDIKNIKLKSVTGFILVDYPNNINQCLLLENYLTGYIEEKRRQKSKKDILISKTNSIIDYKYQIQEKKMDKKSGLNFIVNISTKESIINERFESAKYDPVDKVLYTGQNIQIEDKIIKERLVNKIPNLPKELFEYYKDEYNNNISKIINFYSEFGFLIKNKNEDFDFLDTKREEKMIKTFYYIESEDLKEFLNLGNKKSKNKKVKKKRQGKKEEKKEVDGKKKPVEENIIKDKVLNFINKNLIEKLYQENEKYEEELFKIEFSKYNKKDKKKPISSEQDLNINEIKTKYKDKSSKKLNGILKEIDYDKDKIDIIIKNLSIINDKYYKNLGIFIKLMKSQKIEIYERLNLIQTEFRNYLNKKNPKKRKIISNFIKKYNSLYIINPEYLKNEKVISQLSSDIEDVRTEIWQIIYKKQNDSVEELNQIKYCSFIEVELIKFYNNIRNLIFNETEKFLVMFNNMILFYTKIKNKENHNINILINEEFNSKLITSPEIVFKNTKDFKYHFNKKNDAKVDITLEEVIDIISHNIEIIFKNSIKMLFNYHNQLTNIFKKIKRLNNENFDLFKKSVRFHKKNRKNSEKKIFSSKTMNNLLNGKDNDNDNNNYSQENYIKNMFLEEKNKFKFRLCFIKSFSLKYIQIIKSTAEKVFDNMDEWIIKNVTLQSESLNYLIHILKNFLFYEKKLIDQENDIDYIELDEFEKIIDDIGDNDKKLNKINKNNNSSNISEIGISSNINGSISSVENDINLKPFDNSSVINNRIYNRINLNFLILDNFIETKIEKLYDKENIKNGIKPKIKIIPPNYKYILNNSEFNKENNSFSEIKGEQSIISNTRTFKRISNDLNKNEFYFDIEKFKYLYKLVKKYEVEDGYINKDVFFEIFIRQFLISKKNNSKKNKNDFEYSYDKNNINYFYNEEMNINDKQIFYNDNDNINDNINEFPMICKSLKKLNMKQIKRIYNCFSIEIKQFNYIKQSIPLENKIEKEKKEIKKENDDKEKKDIKKERKQTKRKVTTLKKKEQNQISTSKEKIGNDSTLNETKEKKLEENNKSIINNIEEKKEDIEYNIYLNTKEIFTILPLIGVNILTPEIEEKMEKNLKDKLIMGKYLDKKNFFEFKFWFESFFEYYNHYEGISGINIIKEFLFDLWKIDENSTYFNFQKFLDVMKINKYITDLIDFNDVKYYDIIFS